MNFNTNRTTKKILLALLLSIYLFVFVACGAAMGSKTDNATATSVYPLTITDDLGNQVVIDKAPQRIVSSSPSITEILFALGLGDSIVGVSNSCDYPEEAQSKPQLFDFAGPNIEGLLSAKPDIILSDVAYGIPEDTMTILKNSNVTIVLMTYNSVDDVLDNILLIGQITDKNKEADLLVKKISADIDSVAAKAKKQPQKSVFINIGDLYTTGANTYMDDMLNKLGAKNIAAEAGQGWLQLPVETLLEKDPDVYIDISVQNSGDMPADPLLSNLSAIQKKHYATYAFSSNETSLLSRPGPRVAEALQLLYDTIFEK